MFHHFKILKNKIYAAYFYSQLFSFSGSWLQTTAQGWLVYRISHSAAWLGLITFVAHITSFLVAPISGAIVDRKNRRKLMIKVEIAAFIQSLVFAVLIFTNKIELWHIAVLAVLMGIVNAFDMNLRHSFVLELTGREDLISAISLNSIAMNSARVVGPALAGIMIYYVGEGMCIFVNALSYIPVIFVLLWIRPQYTPKISERHTRVIRRIIRDIKAGWEYVRTEPIIYTLLILTMFISFIGFPYLALLPAIAKTTYHGNANTLGLLSLASGFGGVAGSLTTKHYESTYKIQTTILVRILCLGLSFIGLSFASNIPLAMLALFGVGYCMMGSFPILNNAVQVLVEDELRGRVMSLYMMTFLGTAPWSSLLAGKAADLYGIQAVFIVSGIVCALFCGVFFLRMKYISPRA